MSIECPNCGEKIFYVEFSVEGNYNGIEYDYEEETTVYKCPLCGEEIEEEIVAEL